MPLFIAEVSSNHSCDLDRSLAFIDAAADAGCEAVKFQLFRIRELFSSEVLERSATHRAREAWELPPSFLPHLAQRCKERNIQFCCTPFSLEAVEQLRPYVEIYKVASYELLWLDLIRACAATGKPVILSTGMATMDEIGAAVEAARSSGCRDLTLLHCISGYPTPADEANLAAIDRLRQAFQCRVGWSDHTTKPSVLYRAIHRWGAEVIEFHLDLDAQGAEYAAGHCWLPGEIAPVIAAIGEGFSADGNGIKVPMPAELPDREWRADPSDGLRPLKTLRGRLPAQL